MFTTVRTHLKDVNRWSISQYEELINNLSNNHCSASLFWDAFCREEFLSALQKQQKEFYSFWKELNPEMINWFMDDLSQKYYDALQNKIKSKISKQDFLNNSVELQFDMWRKKSGFITGFRPWKK